MFLLVLMGLVLALMETVMDSGNLSLSIGGLLKPTNPNEICPKTHYRKPFFIVLMVKSWWFVMFVIVCDGSIVFLSWVASLFYIMHLKSF